MSLEKSRDSQRGKRRKSYDPSATETTLLRSRCTDLKSIIQRHSFRSLETQSLDGLPRRSYVIPDPGTFNAGILSIAMICFAAMAQCISKSAKSAYDHFKPLRYQRQQARIFIQAIFL